MYAFCRRGCCRTLVGKSAALSQLTFGWCPMSNLQNLQKFMLSLGFCLWVASGDSACAQGFDRGGFGGGPPPIDQMFSRMDRNSDGRLTEDEVPSFLRDRMQGVDLRRGATQQDITQAFERMRQERESSSSSSRSSSSESSSSSSSSGDSRYSSSSRSSSSGDSSSRDRDSRDSRSSSSSSRSMGLAGPARPRLTVDLPLSYADGDLDGDGQIGFYEWRKWRRNQTETFFTIDTDADGFLTPTELLAAPSVLAAAARNSASAVPVAGGPAVPGGGSSPATAGVVSAPAPVLSNGRRGFPGAPPPVTSGASPSTVPAVSTGNAPSGDEPNDGLRRRAESMFRSLDRNRDGSITEDEWSRSRTLRPQFEGGGVDLTKPMSSDVFVETYLKLNPNS
jgi:hypothetical protein